MPAAQKPAVAHNSNLMNLTFEDRPKSVASQEETKAVTKATTKKAHISKPA
jgi:hypothetical protein